MAKFQTSFIPKKQTPVKNKQEKNRRGGLGVLGFGALVLLLLMLIGTGALYLYKIILEGNIEKMSNSIARVQEAIDPDLIAQLKDVDARIETAKILLANRTVASPIFRLLEDKTIKSIGYSELRYNIEDSGQATLTLSGSARNYSSLALQSDVFGGVQALEEPIFENLSLSDRGNVTFSFSSPIKNSFILYEENLGTIPRFVGPEDSGSTSSSNNTPTEGGGSSESQATADELDSIEEELGTLDEEGVDELLEELNF